MPLSLPGGAPRADAVVVAAGAGARFSASASSSPSSSASDLPKQFLPLGGRPLLTLAAEALLTAPGVERVAVTLPAAGFAAWRERVAPFLAFAGDRLRFCPGGATRQESVRLGLRALAAAPAAGGTGAFPAEGPASPESPESPELPELIAVHDGARPAPPPDLIRRVLRAGAEFGAAAPVTPPMDTLWRLGPEGRLGEVLPREAIGAAQTPQCFRRALLVEALEAAAARGFTGTDEASLVRAAGHPVAAVPGSPRNLKVTTPADLDTLRAALPGGSGGRDAGPARLGFGFDAHRFGTTGACVLGGVVFPETPALLGHSDGDALFHALADAVLGALAAPDLGSLFPSADEGLRGAASGRFLRRAVEIAAAGGYAPGQADLTVIGEKPRLAPRREQVRESVAAVLGTPPGAVGLKATTTDGLGFPGRGEGLAVQALVRLDPIPDPLSDRGPAPLPDSRSDSGEEAPGAGPPVP